MALFKILGEHFTLFGVDFQYWMPIFVGASTIYIIYLWKAGRLK